MACGVVSIEDSYSLSCVPVEWCGDTKEFDGDLVLTTCYFGTGAIRSLVFGSAYVWS